MKVKKATIRMLLITVMLLQASFVYADETLMANHYADYYVADQNIAVKYNMTYTGSLTALGLRIQLPANWAFVSIKGDNLPDVKPKEGVKGSIEFAWIKPPVSPISFVCEFNVPSGERGEKQISTSVIYRRMGQEMIAIAQPDPLLINN